MSLTYGVDLSHWQSLNAQDFEKMRNKGDLKFAIVKATEGDDFIDGDYSKHIKLARQNSMIVGAYHMLDGYDDIRGQVQNFLDTTGSEDIQPDFYVLDIEKDGISPLEVALFVAEFPYPIGVYSSENILDPKYEKVRHLFSFEWLAHYVIWSKRGESIWLAELDEFDPFAYGEDLPPAPLWQFTNNMKFSSPDGKENMDCNVFLGDMQALLRYIGVLSE